MPVVAGHRALVNIAVEILDFSLACLLIIMPISPIFRLVGVVVSAVAVPAELLELTLVGVSVAVGQNTLKKLVHHPYALERITVLEF